MYSNESKKGFSIIDLIIKIIFAALFIFILIWLFNKKMPNMKPVYSGIYRENIKYMQDAGEAYFTDDKMPSEPGESVRLTLDDMEKLNLVVPFVDKDGNTCDKDASYVSITKLENEDGYELKTNLVCGSESSYVVKKLGCHNYCPNANNGNGGKCPECNCDKKCEVAKITEYQFRKLVNGTQTKYSCSKGYTLKGSKCIKTTLKDSKSALVKKTESKTYMKPATLVKGDSKLKQLTTVVTTSTDTKDATKGTKTETINATAGTATETINATAKTSTSTINATANTGTSTINATAGTQKYTCQKTKYETQCSTSYVSQAYSCDCKTTIVRGVSTTTCNTCYTSVPVQSCRDVPVTYNDTCTKTVYSCPSGYTLSGQKCNKSTTTYSCPSGYTLSGTKCNKSTTTYSCPNGYTLSGQKCNKSVTTYSCPSGYTLSGTKCNKNVTVYSCPSGYTLSGTKCSKKVTTYSCPSGTDVKEGSGSSLKCYEVISGSTYYKCDSGWSLNGSTCTKTEKVKVTVKECKDKGYKLEGNKCNLYSTKTVNATAKKINTTYYKYVWSKNTTVAGYEPTGKTRTVNGKEICK